MTSYQEPYPGQVPSGSSAPQGAHTPGFDAGASTTGEYPDVENDSLGSIVSRVTNDLSTLMRQELALAKAEMREEAKTAGKGAGMLAGAGLAAWLMLVCFSFFLIWLLDKIMDLTWAALIVTLIWGAIAATLAILGRNTLRKVNPKPEQTVESVKEDAQWLKARKN